jgi:hypothetical protein
MVDILNESKDWLAADKLKTDWQKFNPEIWAKLKPNYEPEVL